MFVHTFPYSREKSLATIAIFPKDEYHQPIKTGSTFVALTMSRALAVTPFPDFLLVGGTVRARRLVWVGAHQGLGFAPPFSLHALSGLPFLLRVLTRRRQQVSFSWSKIIIWVLVHTVPTCSSVSAVTLWPLFRPAALGVGLLLHLAHPSGQPGTQGAGGPTSVLADRFQLRKRHGGFLLSRVRTLWGGGGGVLTVNFYLSLFFKSP